MRGGNTTSTTSSQEYSTSGPGKQKTPSQLAECACLATTIWVACVLLEYIYIPWRFQNHRIFPKWESPTVDPINRPPTLDYCLEVFSPTLFIFFMSLLSPSPLSQCLVIFSFNMYCIFAVSYHSAKIL